MSKNITLVALGFVVIILALVLWKQKIPTQEVKNLETAVQKEKVSPFESAQVASVSGGPVYMGKAFPFSFSYQGTINNVSHESLFGENYMVRESLFITFVPPAHELNPEAYVSAWKAEAGDLQTAEEYCAQLKNSTTLEISNTDVYSLTINGYPACYSVGNAGMEKAFIDHVVTVSNNGYFVRFQFREQTSELDHFGEGDIYTQRNYHNFMPLYKSIVYSVKIP